MTTVRQRTSLANLNIHIFVGLTTEACLLYNQGEREGNGTEEQVEVLQCSTDEQLNSIPSSAEEFVDNTPLRDIMKPCEADSTKENSEDDTNAAWWNKKLQRNAESELLDGLEDEDNTDIRFKLSSSDSGTS